MQVFFVGFCCKFWFASFYCTLFLMVGVFKDLEEVSKLVNSSLLGSDWGDEARGQYIYIYIYIYTA